MFIKKLLILSLCLSSFTINQNSKANAVEVAADLFVGAIVITGIAAICTGIAGIKVYFAYQRGKEQYRILREFHENPYYTYEQLKTTARNLYYEQTWSPSSISLDSDFPVVWLEKQATHNKNTLGCCVWKLFDDKYSRLSKNLGEKLNFLRNHVEFVKEKKEYNDKYREQNYRDTRLSIEQQRLNLSREKLNVQRGW
jgi:hypothetical protein